MRIFIFIFLFSISLIAKEVPNHSTIFVYHHVSNKTPKLTSISPELFKKHLKYLKENNYKVWPLDKIISHLETNKSIPKKVVSITFDDAYKSVYTNAYTLLKEYNFPFTVFINTSAINTSSLYLTWKELKKMKPLISYGSHSHFHHFLIREDKEFIKKDLQKAHKILKDKLNVEARLFAYPFGEFDEKTKKIVEEFNYYGITQESGSVDKAFNNKEIPRFPMNFTYGKLDRFKMVLNMKPLHIEKVNPKNRSFKENELENRSLNFTLEETDDFSIKQLNCFDASGTKLEKNINKIEKKFLVEIPLPSWNMGRKKITCTVPSKTLKNVFYWNSELFYIKSANNKWYKP